MNRMQFFSLCGALIACTALSAGPVIASSTGHASREGPAVVQSVVELPAKAIVLQNFDVSVDVRVITDRPSQSHTLRASFSPSTFSKAVYVTVAPGGAPLARRTIALTI